MSASFIEQPAAVPSWRARLEQRVQRLWFAPQGAHDRAVLGLLWPLQWAVAAIASSRRRRIARAKAHRPSGSRPPVIVIGNLLVGGTGKTPLIIALARALQERGWRPAIIARGYRSTPRLTQTRQVAHTDCAATVGDEPLLVARRTGLPVIVSQARRAALAYVTAAGQCDVVLSDDGLQHQALPRDLELAVFDARGVGNGRCLPAGPLREPLSGALLMDAVVLNGVQTTSPIVHSRIFNFSVTATEFIQLNGQQHWTPTAFTQAFGAQSLDAIAGLGAPQRFFDTLSALGLTPRCHSLGDHAPIEPTWLDTLQGRWLIMTEKDAVKCAHFDPALQARCVVLRVSATLDTQLVNWLEDRLRGKSPA